MLEAEAVSVFADSFAIAVSHVASDDCHNAHLRPCKVTFGSDVVGPAVFVVVFRSDGEDEFRFGVVRCDRAAGNGVILFDRFGEGKAERSAVHLTGDEGCLVVGAGNGFDIG